MKGIRSAWLDFQAQQDEQYLKEMCEIDPHGVGIRIACPGCKKTSWVKLPIARHYLTPIHIACPNLCGAYLPLAAYSPVAVKKEDSGDYDVSRMCPHEGVEFAVNGAICRCPLCGIENPLEVTRELAQSVAAELLSKPGRQRLIEILGTIVSTFDGVMRQCNYVARRNLAISSQVVSCLEKQEADEVEPLYKVNHIKSFQNIIAARENMLPYWDMKSVVSDWDRFVRVFQKRHLFAHSLGVVDKSYIDKSGDVDAVLGKQVLLTEEMLCSLQ